MVGNPATKYQCLVLCRKWNMPKIEPTLPPKIAMPFIKLGGIFFGRFNIDECSPVESVKNSKKPILIIHGEDDLFVPCQMSKTIFDNCTSEKQHIVFKGAGHGLSCLVSPLEYEKASIEFINKYI